MYSISYFLAVVLINVGFAHVPLIHGWPPMSLAVGVVFVLRDFAQREIGHGVLLLMLAGAVVSYFMASPFVAVASCAAYLAGEAIDWAVFTFSRRSLADRVLLSSSIGTPIDSLVFLGIIGALSLPAMLAMTLSKMLAAVAWWAWLRKCASL